MKTIRKNKLLHWYLLDKLVIDKLNGFTDDTVLSVADIIYYSARKNFVIILKIYKKMLYYFKKCKCFFSEHAGNEKKILIKKITMSQFCNKNT